MQQGSQRVYFTEWDSFEKLESVWDKTLRELTRMSVIVENAVDLGI